MTVFQPGEETAQGARAMIADGMVRRFPRPGVPLGRHVMPLRAGQLGRRTGTMLSAGDSWCAAARQPHARDTGPHGVKAMRSGNQSGEPDVPAC